MSNRHGCEPSRVRLMTRPPGARIPVRRGLQRPGWYCRRFDGATAETCSCVERKPRWFVQRCQLPQPTSCNSGPATPTEPAVIESPIHLPCTNFRTVWERLRVSDTCPTSFAHSFFSLRGCGEPDLPGPNFLYLGRGNSASLSSSSRMS